MSSTMIGDRELEESDIAGRSREAGKRFMSNGQMLLEGNGGSQDGLTFKENLRAARLLHPKRLNHEGEGEYWRGLKEVNRNMAEGRLRISAIVR